MITRLVALALLLLLLLLHGCFCPAAGTAVANAEAGSAEERSRPSKITTVVWQHGGAMVTTLPGAGGAAVPERRHRVVRFCPPLAILG